MRKYLISSFILLAILIPLVVWGWGVVTLGGGQVDSAAKSYLMGPITFESGTYSTGEIDGQDSWAETTATTDQHMVSSAQAYAGTQSYHCDTAAAATGYIGKTHTEQSGVHTIEFWLLATDASGDSNRIQTYDGTVSGAASGVCIKVDANNIEAYYSSAWNQVTSGGEIADDNTWYEIEIEVDPANDVFDLWFNNVKKGTDVAFRSNLTAPDTFGAESYGVADDDLHIDNLEIYTGVRQ